MRVRRVVDLSVPLGPATQVYPGDPVATLTPHTTVAREGYNILAVTMGSQTGTHVDAPFHFADDGARIDAMDLSLFVGAGVVLDVRGLPARGRITWDLLAPSAAALGPGSVALLHTGWSTHYGTPAYFDHPFLDADACRRLLDLGVRTVCLDAPNIDETPDDDHPGEGFPVHHLIAEVSGVIGENLTNLAAVDWPDPLVAVLPVRLEGADGAPVRAVAMQLA